MLILALVAWLATSAPETVTPIPGTRFRLGMTETQLQRLGEFTPVKATDAAGSTSLRGDAKFFGVPCKATLHFRDGRLARAHFGASGVAPHARDYIESQLRRSKLWRECVRFEPDNHVCDWLGAVKIHLEILNDRLDARVEPPPRPWEAESDSAVAAAPADAAPAAASPSPNAIPPAPEAATAQPAPTAVAPSTAVPERSSEAIATLAETLRLSLPERNPPSVWPRMTAIPKLVYPDSARRQSVQGIVWVLALVDADGVVRSAGIDRGIPELNDAAIAWVLKARFAPCVRDQRPCRFWVRVAARFTLY